MEGVLDSGVQSTMFDLIFVLESYAVGELAENQVGITISAGTGRLEELSSCLCDQPPHMRVIPSYEGVHSSPL
jgi:hypothetical protein